METSPCSRTFEARTIAKKEHSTWTRGDGKLLFPKWPSLKASTSRSNLKASADSETSPEECASSSNTPGSGLRHIFIGAGWSTRKTDAKRPIKKIPSIPEPGPSPMTTVQEICLDSRMYSPFAALSSCSFKEATIPGHLLGGIVRPAIQRSLSFPEEASRRLSEGRTPRATDFPKVQDGGIVLCLQPTDSSQHDTQRRSLLLASKELKPLIIPSSSHRGQDSKPFQPIAFNQNGDTPPKVPPKSPRTESRASPRITSKKPPHSASTSVSTIHTATSVTSSNSFGSWSDTSSPRPLRTPVLKESPASKLKGLENVVPRSVPMPSRNNSPSGQTRVIENVSFKTPISALDESPSKLSSRIFRDHVAPPMIKTNTSPALPSGPYASQPSGLSKEDEVLVGLRKTAKPLITTSYHQRGHSEPTHVQTPTKRSIFVRADTTSIHGLLKTIVSSPTRHVGDMSLPCGFKAVDATANVPAEEAKALKLQADKEIEKFEVLQGKDVSMLSQELELLDERCSYLQSTHRSLREGRKSLHMRMITYLKSPRMAQFSRDSILKQEEALAELDISIDDWVSKLEAAEDRRTKIRQRLLQHIAAAVTLQTNRQSTTVDPTPPTSPEEKDNYISTERRDVQSIKIYADEGVATLLAEIEKEIDFMAESGLDI